ncbi:putative mitochondrial protein, partial [Mucuna pruriens]
MESSKPISMLGEEKLKLAKESEGKRVDATQYKSLIGSLRNLTAIRPNIVFGVGLLSRFMEELRTLTNGFFYTNNNNVKLVGYTDSDWARDLETRKSTL